MASITRKGTAISKISLFSKVSLALLFALAAFADDKRVALTLDDGPNPPYTEKFLQLLKHENIKATFFFIGRNIQMHRASALSVTNAGHEIGNHSFMHERLSWLGFGRTASEIHETDQQIRSLGYKGPIPFRAPFGERWGLHTWVLWYLGRKNILYDVAPVPPDYFRSEPQAIAESTLARTRPGSILLFHDGEGIRVEALEAAALVIKQLKSQGYRFVTISELLGTKGLLLDGE
jgi:peptidoglycan/xylan/chitin deacetylase (PgdA/CDA1 family)